MNGIGSALRPGGRWLWLLAMIWLAGCTPDADEPVRKAQPGPVPETAQRSGDPERGWHILVNEGYVTCGIPYRAWQRATGGTPAGAPTVPGREGVNAELPYTFNHHVDERGVELVTTNCLWCHGGRFEGEVVPGLGNQNLDFTTDPRQFVNAVGNYVRGPDETSAWRKWAQRIDAMAPYMITDTRGVNPAPNLTLALIAHRDPETLAWYDEPRLALPPPEPLPVKVPPWWRMSRQHAMFHNAMGRGDQVRYMMMKALVCTDTLAEARRLDEQFAHVRAYIASLEAPRWPYDLDRELAARGETVFDAHCAHCHGRYPSSDGEKGHYPNLDYPNLVIDLETVGTDPAYALQAYEDSDHFMRWFNSSWFGETAEARPAPGYRAPPLDGVWITAPFLHNGSVPTLAALLDSSQRPAYWTRDFDDARYDPEAVGWAHEALPHGKDGAADASSRRRIYDTTLPGYSNQGHTFGDDLPAGDRRALLEYLKTL